jgi:hypothetical protein
MQDRSKSYQSYGSSRSTSSGYTPYSSQTRISSYLGGSSETRNTPSTSYTSYGSEAQSTAYRASANEIRGADIIAEYLVKEKVPYILGYAGHGAIGLLDGVYKQTDRIRHVSPRIEQAAGFMADVYYRLTGQPLAVYASTGPGPMNLLISVTNAYYDASAYFVITAQVPTNQFNTGALQDDYRYHGDMSSMFAPVVKKSWRIRKVEDLVKALPDAFSLMRSGRPGPVHFDMPYDLYMRTGSGHDARAERTWLAAQLADHRRRRDGRESADASHQRTAAADPRRRRRARRPCVRGTQSACRATRHSRVYVIHGQERAPRRSPA